MSKLDLKDVHTVTSEVNFNRMWILTILKLHDSKRRRRLKRSQVSLWDANTLYVEDKNGRYCVLCVRSKQCQTVTRSVRLKRILILRDDFFLRESVFFAFAMSLTFFSSAFVRHQSFILGLWGSKLSSLWEKYFTYSAIQMWFYSPVYPKMSKWWSIQFLKEWDQIKVYKVLSTRKGLSWFNYGFSSDVYLLLFFENYSRVPYKFVK